MSVDSVQDIWRAYEDANDLAVLGELVKKHHWVLDVPAADQTLLNLAIVTHDAAAVALLLELGDEPNKPDTGGFPHIITAVSVSGECDPEITIRIIRVLASADADLDYCGSSGYRPLHWAAHGDQPWLIRALVEFGADIDGRMSVDGELTPLMVAMGLGNRRAADTLIELGADKTLKSERSLIHEGGLTASDLAGKLCGDDYQW